MIHNTMSDIRDEFILQEEELDDDNGMLEITNACFIADEPKLFGTLNDSYIEREWAWYISESLNVNDIEGTIPTIWKNISAEDGSINSNYGWCQFSDANHNQFDKAIANLQADPTSRQGSMIFTRPTMHEDAVKGGMRDFMCTYSHQIMIRDGKLHYHVYMRSNDAVFGYKNDKAWADYVHQRAASKLCVPMGNMYWNAASLHIYPQHRKLVK